MGARGKRLISGNWLICTNRPRLFACVPNFIQILYIQAFGRYHGHTQTNIFNYP